MSLNGHPHELMERGLEGTLSPSEEDALRLHLKSCAECAEEYTFARRAREELGRAGTAPSPKEMEAMRSRVEAKLASGPALTRVPLPMLAGASAAAVLLLWLAAGGGSFLRSLGRRSALDLGGTTGSAAVLQEEMRLAARLSRAGRIRGPHSPLSAVLLADFESARGLDVVTLSGGIPAELSGDGFWGKKALRIARGGPKGEPIEARFAAPVLPAGARLAGVSAWVKSEAGTTDIALAAGLLGGQVREFGSWRRIRPGRWMWAFFPVPAGAMDSEERLGDLRLRIEGESPALLDRVEVWFKSGGGG